jgi:hypothetical protein
MDMTAGGSEDSCDDFEQCTFACTIFSDDTDCFTLFYLKTYIIECIEVFVVLLF